ncbi:MAG: 30S ribosomal protein S7 [Candidatus Omnitrophica bacterium]|nr:30S ribosomal protein S7 [Candidatus Omnitrophota bacterium]MBU4345877.1 30S ribosomal protein S7 [Candidatus Omnitrophota bacterium]MBU4473066.1 30S ribosomal protein S7 [Candidatus Omnitrophota bacterium]MCG2706643.1 30S ribosomal protein S7 [Candidatus Omnitrophota bacterium]
MRRRRVSEREILADPKFNSKSVAMFINMLMLDGKKSLAEKIIYDALEIVKQQLNEADALKIFHKAIENARPRLEVKPRRVGGATYQIPVEVRQERSVSLALRWIRDFAKARKGKSMKENLAEEILAAYKGEGAAIKKRDDTHKMAEANKAFAHFRW